MMKASQGQIVEFGSHLIHRAEWITPPDAVSWFPQTTLWKLVAFSCLLLIIGYVIYRIHQYLSRAYLRDAWTLYQNYASERKINRIATLLKRLAHQHWPEESIGTMNTAEFAEFIAQRTNNCLTYAQVIELVQTSYCLTPNVSSTTLDAVHRWFQEVTC